MFVVLSYSRVAYCFVVGPMSDSDITATCRWGVSCLPDGAFRFIYNVSESYAIIVFEVYAPNFWVIFFRTIHCLIRLSIISKSIDGQSVDVGYCGLAVRGVILFVCSGRSAMLRVIWAISPFVKRILFFCVL